MSLILTHRDQVSTDKRQRLEFSVSLKMVFFKMGQFKIKSTLLFLKF